MLPLLIVLGVSTIDGTSTDVLVVSLDGRQEHALTIDHAKGRIPKGIVDGDKLITVSVVPDETGTVVDEFDLSTSMRRTIGTGAIPIQAPSARGFIRQPKEGVFEIVRDGSVITKREASWLKPFADGAFLEIGLDGSSRIIVTSPSSPVPGLAPGVRTHELGKARVRSPAQVGAEIVMERDDGAIIDLKGRILHKGLPGMDPIALGDRVVLGAGTKSAKVLVARVSAGKLRDIITLDAKRAGIATPKAATLVNGEPVVVAWVDRGASLPGELWLLTTKRASRIVDSAAVEVFGFLPPPGASPGTGEGVTR